jgi:hypothetical protein
MTKTLEMVFKNQGGTNVTISVLDPKEGLTMATVKAVMNSIIAKNIFSTKNGDLTFASEARIRVLNVDKLV